VSSIKIHGYVWKVELLDGVGDTLEVSGLGIGAFLNRKISNEISKTVGFWRKC